MNTIQLFMVHYSYVNIKFVYPYQNYVIQIYLNKDIPTLCNTNVLRKIKTIFVFVTMKIKS